VLVKGFPLVAYAFFFFIVGMLVEGHQYQKQEYKSGDLQFKTGCIDPLTIEIQTTDDGFMHVTYTPVPCPGPKFVHGKSAPVPEGDFGDMRR
jgi:hypothetical protein